MSLLLIAVALNQQSQGLESDLNVARFKQNGNCGYVLKPHLLRESCSTFNPQSTSSAALPGIVPRVLQIKVSGFPNVAVKCLINAQF